MTNPFSQIDLLYFPASGFPEIVWNLGDKKALPGHPRELAIAIEDWIKKSTADYVLFWDGKLGVPDPENISTILKLPGDVWHAGLRLGTGDLPTMIDFVEPIWMLNRNPNSNHVATSWRISLRACLMRTEVLRQLGFINPNYESRAAAALDMGCRFIRRGAFVRHVPQLISSTVAPEENAEKISVHDELQFIADQYGRRWLRWAMFRALWNGYRAGELFSAYIKISPHLSPLPQVGEENSKKSPLPQGEGWVRGIYNRALITHSSFDPKLWHDRVTILIPTLQRYSYLKNELEQLRHQTVRLREIMIVDQTPADKREVGIEKEFSDLPLKVCYQDVQGQCTAWNEAIRSSTGEYLLFLGDDADRIAPDFVEKFLRTFELFKVDMVASTVEEKGAGPIPESCTFMRIADGFPICMIRRDVFRASGLLDYAYDRGARADADLGLRCYIKGALMILDPSINVFHHRAPRGGLRAHKARVITFAGSRQSIFKRDLPGVTEVYLAKRYFSSRQETEMLWQRAIGTFSVQGNLLKKILKCMVSLFFLPQTLSRLRRTRRQAAEMLRQFPQIPALSDAESEAKKI